MKPYALELRERMAQACDEGGETRQETAERFGVSVSFIRKLLARRRQSGQLAAKAHAGGFASAMDERAQEILAKRVGQQPDATLKELQRALAQKAGVARSLSVISSPALDHH